VRSHGLLLVGVPLQVLEVLVQEPDSQLLRVVMHDIDLINPMVRVFLEVPPPFCILQSCRHLQHLLFPKGIVMLAFEPTHPLRKQGWRRGGGLAWRGAFHWHRWCIHC
jgi:hypothetical protein